MSANNLYCPSCGELLSSGCRKCPACGAKVLTQEQTVSQPRTTVPVGRSKNKWISFLLCLFTVCGHKFYEGKTGMGILYLCTAGLFGVGWIIDLIQLFRKPTTYYV